MTLSMGRITARLAEPKESVPAGLVEMINRNVNPPEPLSAEDVHIRSMYIVSDQVNSFGGRFPEDEHQHLAKLLVDSPVLVGHRKDKLPVGRNFHALKTQRDGRPWVRSFFYWLRSAAGAADLVENIDGGIYKECSVAFTFSLPECSVCGKDIRLCPHQPLEKYTRQGRREACHFKYRQIEKVLETSLVYRGAVPETSMSKALSAGVLEPKTDVSLKELESSTRYLIIPRYDAVEVTATVSRGKLAMTLAEGKTIGCATGFAYQPEDFQPEQAVRGLLVGYRGKDRCPAYQTIDFVERQAGPVSRLVFNVLPNQGIDKIAPVRDRSGLDVRLIPYREASIDEIDRRALEIMTRDGVELWPVGVNPAKASRVVYHPSLRDDSRSSLTLITDGDGVTYMRLRPKGGGDPMTLTIPGFGKQSLHAGRGFAAWPVSRNAISDAATDHNSQHSTIESITKSGDGYRLKANGVLKGLFALRPMKLNGRRAYLFSRISGGAQ